MNKLSIVVGMVAMMVWGAAMADGFVCGTNDGALSVKVYNHTDASEGTRNAAVLVISDKSVQGGRKTIAKFSDVESTLVNYGAIYVADVSEALAQGARGG